MSIDFDNRQLDKRILSDRYNRLVFSSWHESPPYLVGGYLRDILNGEASRDRDYVAKADYESLLIRIVGGIDGKIIRIGYLSRMVLRDKSTLDFTPMANDIRDDLARRDFTINALAWSPETGLLDPYGGLHDLRKKSIRMISRANIESDPIRILRAYRFAGELGFRINGKTRNALRDLSSKVIEAKSERITLEFFKILNLRSPLKILRMMSYDGVLKLLIPLAAEDLRVRLRALSRVDKIFNALPLKYKEMAGERYSQNLLYIGLIRLEVLLEGVSSAALLMSSKILKRVRDIESGDQILTDGHWSYDSLFEAFSVMGEAAVDFLVIRRRKKLLSEYERFQSIMTKGILSPDEITSATGLGGEALGRAIRILRRGQFRGGILSSADALLALKKYQSNLT